MDKIKRIFAFVLVLVFALSLAMSCKGKENPGDSEESRGSESTSESLSEEDDYSRALRTQGIDFGTTVGLVKDYSVAISSSATATEKYAAEQLIKYASEVTGKTLGYSADGAYRGEKVISVGRTESLGAAGIKAEKSELGSDGFVIKTDDETLYICGGDDRGTLYGVYDFLEYFLGVKFLTADVTYVPENQSARVYKADRTEIPAFDYRVYLDPSSFFNDSAELTTARRFTSEYLKIPESAGGNLKWYQGYDTHNSLQWVKVTKYLKNGKLDPVYTEAFANDGVNVIIDEHIGGLCLYAADLCYTDGINEDGTYKTETVNADGTTRKTAIGMTIDGMTEVIKNDKDNNNYYLFGQSDIYNRPCLCSRCVAAAKKYGDSGIMIRFINALAKAVEQFAAEEGIERDIDVVTFAYQWSAQPPVNKNADGTYSVKNETCVPRANVTVRLAPIGMNRFVTYDDPAQDNNVYGSDYMKKWALVCNKFMVWDYTTYNPRHYWWYPAYTTWHDRLTSMKEMGVVYAMLQSNYQERTIYQTIFEPYVASKMLWNPDYDMNELIAEFNRYYFGEVGGKYATEYVSLMTAKCYGELAVNDYKESTALSFANKGFLKSMIALIDEAEEKVKQSADTEENKKAYVQRLEVLKFQPRYMYLYDYMKYEADQVMMNIEAKQFILDVMSAGGVYWAEARLFDAENIIFK